MRLIELHLENFQGIREFTFQPVGKDANVYGTNASGKTTLYNAFTWLLFDKSSTGSTGFIPETRDENGEVIHYIDHTVIGVFELDGGNALELKKTMYEDWTQKRGSDVKTLTGRKYSYYVDTLPVTKSQYDFRIAEILPPNLLAILTQPFYFSETMKWQDRRNLLLSLFTVADEVTILNSDSGLAELLTALRKPDGTLHKVNDFKAAQEVKATSLNKELAPIPARIDEAERAKAIGVQYTEEEANKILADCAEARHKLEEEKTLLKGGSGGEAITREINRLTTEKQRLMYDYNQSKYQIEAELKAKTKQMSSDLEAAQRVLDNATRLHLAATRELSAMETRRNTLAAKHAETGKKEWNGETVCPACGQQLPGDQVEAAVAKFNVSKSNELMGIIDDIKATCSKEMIGSARKAVECCEADIKNAESDVKRLKEALLDAESTPLANDRFESTDECRKLVAQIEALQQEAAAGTNYTKSQENALQAKFEALDARENAAKISIMQLTNIDRQNKRIAELKEQSKRLTTEYEATQKLIYLCDQFTRIRARYIDEEINAQFTGVRFRMFVTQFNGGITDVCDVLVKNDDGSWIVFAEANNAARINAGLEIIDAISRKLGKSLPIFIDNAESVVRVKCIAAQMFLLIVSGSDEKLRIETY